MGDDVPVILAKSGYTPVDMTEVRKFGNDRLDAAVRRALDKMPDDHDWALVAIADNTGVRTALAIRPNEHWSFGGYMEKPWAGPLEYGVEVVISG